MSEPALIETGDLIEPLRRMGLVKAGESARLTPLTGGVSSDISLVEAGGRRFCVKRALPRLKVAALWEAPVERNAAEAAYMRAVAALGAACRSARAWRRRGSGLVRDGLSRARAASLMEGCSFSPESWTWISPLRSGAILASSMRGAPPIRTFRPPSPTIPRSRRSASSLTCARPVAPIPSLPRASMSSRATTLTTKRALVHGDISPKNILQGPEGPVFLDAECAWFGDPAFDLAFCLNHLLLKGAREGADRARYLAAFSALADAYLAGVDWEAGGQARSARRRAAAGSFPRPHRRQVAGRISRPRERARRGAPMRHAADLESAASFDGHRQRMGADAMSEPVIQSLVARRIWDSRGRPTVEAEIALSDGATGRGIAPAGASRGSREAIDKRDGGQAPRRSRRAGCACRDHKRNRARAHRARPVRPGRDRRQAHRPRRDAEQGEARRKRADRRFARRSSCRGRKPRPAALAPSPGRRARRSFHCRKSRFLAAARMPDGEPTSRISWSSRRAPKASPRRWK